MNVDPRTLTVRLREEPQVADLADAGLAEVHVIVATYSPDGGARDLLRHITLCHSDAIDGIDQPKEVVALALKLAAQSVNRMKEAE